MPSHGRFGRTGALHDGRRAVRRTGTKQPQDINPNQTGAKSRVATTSRVPSPPGVAWSTSRQSAGDTQNPKRIMELEVVAKVGIEPTTRGFSVRRRGRLGAGTAKTGKRFPLGRPNHPARPRPSRTGTLKTWAESWRANPVQRLRRITTEHLPNRAPGSAPLTETLRLHALLQPRAYASRFGREAASTLGHGRCQHPFNNVAKPLPRTLPAAVCGLITSSHPIPSSRILPGDFRSGRATMGRRGCR